MRELFLLDPEVVFLNHGSYGACPRPVFEEYQRWQRELERQPVEFLARRSDELLDGARRGLGAYLNAAAEDLVFVPNATSGLNVVARSLPLGDGDEVLSTDHEYGALDLTWEHICAKAGARYVRRSVPLPVTSPEEVVEAVWGGVTARTKALFLSHVTSMTALTFPVVELCRRAREAGILSIVDGAHGPGHVPVDLREIGADVYAGNCHKWMCAPKGSAFLHVRPEQQAWVEGMIVSWGWAAGHTFVSRNQWQGTRDLAAFLAVPAAIAFQAEQGWDGVRARCHELAREARRRLAEVIGLGPICPDPAAGWPWFGQMVAAPLPAGDGAAVQRRLYEEYRIEVAVTEWAGRELLRVSFQGYNTEEDLEALVGALGKVLAEAATTS